MECMASETGTGPVDPHISHIVYALAAIINFLDQINRQEQ
jgi:hypothetical protein